jgi:type II secretory pathway pseudopilin PulG
MIFSSKKGFAFIEILLALGIVLFLYYFLAKAYMAGPAGDKNTKKILTEQGIDTSGGKSTLHAVTDKIHDLNEKELERAKQIEDIEVK